ncbi:MAG TPA: LytTR family DNA-binding domain-containing protein [Dinghuibacter sp.]|jgi:DNA-binding LytR/AlgR family response regulator|uniref:LytR/AlgR family response regulator transcription factor n=1 Tax=Dinghuibacter sp. TaxID=2024697 RepID=UPI002C8A5A7E|nr:LytTR family DNA-binding domain-containing protein [Dinghuibacter sp.]HTJ11826.1 LytTR family DNA-binding domain-containing protein [Dinghuibacter sp.]
MIRCILVDDKPLSLDILEAYAARVPYLTVALRTEDPLEALEFLRTHPVDLAFLDIQMPSLGGLELARMTGGRVPVIFTTAYADYALEGYALDVVDYLLKPIPFERFYQAVEKARSRVAAGEPLHDSLFVKTEHRIQRVPLDDILYIEARQNYVSIETAAGRIMSLMNIKSMEERLPAGRFVRVHKSFVVALSKIETIEKSRIYIGEAVIPIGDSYREALFKLLGT